MKHVVRIFAPPLGECAGKNTWENAARRLESRLRTRLAVDLRLEVIHLFSREFFAHPQVMDLVQSGKGDLPIVVLNGTVIQSGGKLSERTIRESLGL